MFSFAAPLALGLLALAIPIIGLYFLKIKLRRVPISTNMFWKQVYEEKPPRSLWQQMRHWISLAVQLLILALLVLAIADPFMPWQKQQAKRLSLVIDTSASMAAVDGVTTRLQLAKNQAIALLNGLRDLDEVAVIEANGNVSVAIGMTNHIPSLRKAISDLKATDASTQLTPAIALAKRLIGKHPYGQVLVFSDGMSREVGLGKPSKTGSDTSVKSESNAETHSTANTELKNEASDNTSSINNIAKVVAQPEAVNATSSVDNSLEKEGDIPVHWHRVGRPIGNIGITQFQARRSLVDVTGYELLVALFNASEFAVEAKVEILLNDQHIDVLPVKLAPGEKWKRSLEKTSQDGGHIVARLTDLQLNQANGPTRNVPVTELNGITSDDQVQAYLPGKKTQRVLIVTPGNLFLRKAFEANPLVQVEVATSWNPPAEALQLPEGSGTTSSTEPTASPPYDLIVFHEFVPDRLPSGNVFVIDPEKDSEAWSLQGEIEDPIVTQQNEASPLMRNLRLDNVLVPRAKKLSFNIPTESLAATIADDSIFTELKRESGRCIVLCVDLDSSDLAFRTAFPILVTNALQWFGRETDSFLPAMKAGSFHSVDLADSTLGSEYLLIDPSGLEQPVASPNSPKDHLIIGPLQKVGLWQIRGLSQTNRSTEVPGSSNQTASRSALQTEPNPSETSEHRDFFAVNLADERETDLSSNGDLVEARQLVSDPMPLMAGAGWLSRPLWFYIAFAACLLCTAEWYMYQRRIIS